MFKMHLALAIGGCTLGELDQRMTEAEFQLWLRYAREVFLPAKRAELQAAQTALLVAVTMGGSKRSVSLNDFVIVPAAIDEDDKEPDAKMGGAVLGAMTSVKVHRLSQGRKLKA